MEGFSKYIFPCIQGKMYCNTVCVYNVSEYLPRYSDTVLILKKSSNAIYSTVSSKYWVSQQLTRPLIKRGFLETIQTTGFIHCIRYIYKVHWLWFGFLCVYVKSNKAIRLIPLVPSRLCWKLNKRNLLYFILYYIGISTLPVIDSFLKKVRAGSLNFR